VDIQSSEALWARVSEFVSRIASEAGFAEHFKRSQNMNDCEIIPSNTESSIRGNFRSDLKISDGSDSQLKRQELVTVSTDAQTGIVVKPLPANAHSSICYDLI
jgi:hypothetical protein